MIGDGSMSLNGTASSVGSGDEVHESLWELLDRQAALRLGHRRGACPARGPLVNCSGVGVPRKQWSRAHASQVSTQDLGELPTDRGGLRVGVIRLEAKRAEQQDSFLLAGLID